ncbi:hypothetical protein E5675_10270 [Sphingopyxis sp. PAMC25046]|uniref:hypothetical protein n=1 Tax=Sphingopyxis sp. PAMC25046 TaxID=2565556 RepID=UPI00109DF263|nr:hypothetical protein [Sphingopyxis sp. PAMC25046]QCB54778.1 hypothetical protein E5675_10270 [Sphingopyxis sp. PAMC25046]
MTKTILRSAIAAMIGIVVAFALIWLAQYAGSEVSPDVYDPNSGEILIPVGSTIALIAGWFIGTFAGGWLAMRVSAGTGPGWVVAGAVIGAALYRAVTLADSWWIMALGVAVPLVAVWLAQRATNIITD